MAFDCTYEITDGVAHVTLTGELDAGSAGQFKTVIEQISATRPARLVLLVGDLVFMASAGLRVLVFAKQKMGIDVSIYVVGAQGPVLNTLQMSGFHQSVYLQDTYTG